MNSKRNRISILKKVISMVLSFFLFVFLTVSVILACLYFNLFEPHSALKALEKSNYYEGVTAQFETNAWDITIPLGLPQSVVQNLVSVEQVKRDMNAVINGHFESKKVTVDTTPIVRAVDDRVRTYFSTQGKTLSEGQNTVLTQYMDTLGSEYLKLTNIAVLEYCGMIKASYSKLILVCLCVLCAFSVISLVILFSIHHYRHRSLRYVAYATISATAAVSIVPALSYFTGC
ncbi:MAG: hypothetical protein RSC76_05600, partial [Oscillospiraceae bacterium]